MRVIAHQINVLHKTRSKINQLNQRDNQDLNFNYLKVINLSVNQYNSILQVRVILIKRLN